MTSLVAACGLVGGCLAGLWVLVSCSDLVVLLGLVLGFG